MSMRQQFVNDHFSQGRDLFHIVPAGRAAEIHTRTPPVSVIPLIQIGAGWVLYRQRESLAIGYVIPTVLVVEIVYGLSGGIFQDDLLAAVTQAAGIFAGYHRIYTVLGGKRLEVFDHENIFTGCNLHVRECKFDSIREAYQVQVEYHRPDILKFDEFPIGIVGFA